MAYLLEILNPQVTDYVDRKFRGTRAQYFQAIAASSTLYIGNLSFFTTEEQVHEAFRCCGRIARVIMGLDAVKKSPCGFCFVIYHQRSDALKAVKYLNGTMLDSRPVRVDVDYGFEEGRQYGRGRSGGQVRDEFRTDYDEGRGGFGRIMQYDLLSAAALPGGLPGRAQYFAAGGETGEGVAPAAKRQRLANDEERNPRYRGRGDDRDEEETRHEEGTAAEAGGAEDSRMEGAGVEQGPVEVEVDAAGPAGGEAPEGGDGGATMEEEQQRPEAEG